MSKIECYEGNNCCPLLFFKALQDKIKIICERIGFDDSDILWIIFNPTSRYRNATHHAMLVDLYGMDYGFAKPEINQIWISTKTISSDSCLSSLKTLNALFQKSAHRELLADVILDEITHIQTGLNHGDEDYEYQLKENRLKYYSQF